MNCNSRELTQQMVKEKPHKYLKDLEDMNLNELTRLEKSKDTIGVKYGNDWKI